MSTIITVKERNPYREAAEFQTHNLMEIIEWLGPQFVAVTAGEPIQIPIGDKTVSLAGKIVPDANIKDKLMLVMRDKVRGAIVVAKCGQFIVVGETHGIEVYDKEAVDAIYTIATAKNESAEEEQPPAVFRA